MKYGPAGSKPVIKKKLRNAELLSSCTTARGIASYHPSKIGVKVGYSWHTEWQVAVRNIDFRVLKIDFNTSFLFFRLKKKLTSLVKCICNGFLNLKSVTFF